MHPNHISWIAEHQDIVYMVEATSYEQLSLWQKHHEELDWQEVSRGGPMFNLGELSGRPIVVCVNIFSIHGRNVLFYNPTSQVVDWAMVEDFLEKSWPTVPKTDAMNFFNAVHSIREQNKAAS